MHDEIAIAPPTRDGSVTGIGRTQTRKAAPEPEPEGTEPPQGGKSVPVEKTEPVRTKELSEALEKLNRHMENIGRSVTFRIDGDSGHTVISVIDRETEEVIRQIPAEEALERIRQQPSGVGLLLDVT